MVNGTFSAASDSPDVVGCGERDVAASVNGCADWWSLGPLTISEPVNDNLAGAQPLSLFEAAQLAQANAPVYAIALDQYLDEPRITIERFLARALIASPELMRAITRLGSSLTIEEVDSLPDWQLHRYTIEVVELTRGYAHPGALERVITAPLRRFSRHLKREERG